MAERKIHLQIMAPRGIKVDEMADMVVFRCIDGDIGILPGHEPTSLVVGDGILRVKNGDQVQKIALFGGVATVADDTVTILTSIAQRPGEIDLARAEEDRRQMEQLLQEQADDIQVQGYQVLLRRALVRIEVSEYTQEMEE